MKKSIVLSLFLFLMAGSLLAQEGAKVGFRLSPLVSWASVTNDSTKLKPDGLTTKARLGFSFDFVFTYGFSESVGIKTGINIATKGFGQTLALDNGNGGTVDFNSRTSLTVVEVPIGMKFRSPEIGDGLFIIGHFGVNPELNLANKVISDGIDIDLTTGAITITPDETEARDVDGVNLFTASFVPGAGVDWEFDWGMLEFSATYHLGLLSLLNKDQNNNQVAKMNYIALNLGYFF